MLGFEFLSLTKGDIDFTLIILFTSTIIILLTSVDTF